MRMGIDKATINYHGKTQQEYLCELLSKHCNAVFVSCSSAKLNQVVGYTQIVDLYPVAGPMGALLSAFAHNCHEAWLVVACDMPFVNADAIDFLLRSRNADKLATAFINVATHSPEPLLTIWEPKVWPLLKFAFKNQQCSLRQVLQSAEIQEVEALDAQWLLNINTPEEQKKAGFSL